MQIGGVGQDIELDEISFRSKAVGNRVVWIRYLAIARRGSSKVWLAPLPYRISEGGQGGGGPISLDELREAFLMPDGSSRIAPGSVCHTDSARTYKQLGTMDSPLFDREVFHSEFESLHLAHTAVRHKPPKPEFAKTFNVKVWNGATWVMQERVGGTQKLDGFFASFRREVGRKPFNTSGPTLESADKMEQHLHERMRCFQLAFWLSGNDLFQVFGALRAAKLAAGASWETLKEFLPDRAASSEDRADEERMPCYNIDSESEAMSALFEEDD